MCEGIKQEDFTSRGEHAGRPRWPHSWGALTGALLNENALRPNARFRCNTLHSALATLQQERAVKLTRRTWRQNHEYYQGSRQHQQKLRNRLFSRQSSILYLKKVSI